MDLLKLSVCAATLSLCPAWLFSSEVHFTTLKREVIEERVRRSPAKNPDRQVELEKLFRLAGCDGDRLTLPKVKRSKLPNVVCTLSGEVEEVIVVGAHYDKVDAGEGAVDNWTGASLLPSLFESLRASKRKYTFVFVGFTDEEKGLIGSEGFVAAIPKANRKKYRAMLNMDSLGLTSTKVWVSRSDSQLVDWLYNVAQSMNLPLAGVNVEQVGSSDSESFRSNKIPVLTLHSVTQQTFPLLHTPNDQLSKIQIDDYYQTYRLVSAYLAYLDLKIDPLPVDRQVE